MLEFHVREVIHSPLKDTVRLFRQRSTLSRWQPGLIRDEPLEPQNGSARYKLTFQFGRGNLVLTETILQDRLPDLFVATYASKGITNKVHYTFTETPEGNTLLKGTSEFKFKGLKKLIAIFMRNAFEKQTQLFIKYFKTFAEKEALRT